MRSFYMIVLLCSILLISACQSDDDKKDKPIIEKENQSMEGNTELIKASEAGDQETVKQLLKEDIDIDAQDAAGRTAVVAATEASQTVIVELLIEAGANIDIQNDNEDNVLLYAAAEGQLDIVQLAIEADADTTITNRFGGTALIPAADRGHVAIVKYLLEESDVDIDHVNHLQWTALLEAVLLGDGGEDHQKIVQLLVDHGADVHIADGEGVTPLQHAENNGYTEMITILKNAGA